MQNSPEISWFLEILKIAVPSITTILVGFGLGYWLNARNEKIKAELQLQFYESQVKTEEKKLYLAKLEELFEKINELQKASLLLCMKTLDFLKEEKSAAEVTDLLNSISEPIGRINTLMSFYTVGLEDNVREIVIALNELSKFCDKVLTENKEKLPDINYRNSLHIINEKVRLSCTKLLNKITEQSEQYRHLKINTLDKPESSSQDVH